MAQISHKLFNRGLRRQRVRARISGTAERPRLTVFISNSNVSAQLIDDASGRTLAAATSVGQKTDGNLSVKAAAVGKSIAAAAAKQKIKTVVFDRNGRRYAGRLRALAEAARKEGLEF